MTEPKWEWADSFIGAVMGIILGIASFFGWANGQVQMLHRRINETNGRIDDHGRNLATLEAQQVANRDFQERTDEALSALRAQNTELIRLLSELKGAITNTHRRIE